MNVWRGFPRLRISTAALAATTLLLLLLGIANQVGSLPAGLNGTYYLAPDWSAGSIAATVRELPSNTALSRAWQQSPPETFSASWTGSFLAPRDELYTFSTVSDDGSWLYVDGSLVVDNGGRHGPGEARGAVAVARGVHTISLRYLQEGGGLHLAVAMARGAQPLAPWPDWMFTPRKVAFQRFAVSAALHWGLAGAEWLWAGALVVGALSAAHRAIRGGKRWLQQQQVWPALAWILAGSLLLNAAGLWWGLPDGSWPPDELTPLTVIAAAARHFSHGWWDRYPPFHYYVLTAAFSPLLLFEYFGRIDLGSSAVYTLLAVLGRLISVAAGAGTVVAVYLCGARLFGRRAGLFAAAMLALVVPFVYYAKTANLDVPYLFWFAVSLVFYLRLLDTLKTADFAGFALCATLAVCTKDQAYGLYLITPAVIVYRMWQINRNQNAARPFLQAILDRRLAVAAALAVVTFGLAHNLAANWGGFVQHVDYITTGGSISYRAFEPTAAGRAALLWVTIDLLRVAWGWPLFLIAIAGAIFAMLKPSTRQAAMWLAAPAVSYYLGFIDVVLYNYDRFMLPFCVILAPFGGLALDRWLNFGRRGSKWRTGAVGVAFAYSLVYAAAVDQAMIGDSRYTLERWLTSHATPTDFVGFVFPLQYYPRLERFNGAEITSIGQLRDNAPAYYILNADYARAEPPDSAAGQLIAGLQNGTLGYRLAFQYRQPPPWPWLPAAHRDLVGPRTETLITSALRHINPTYQVFERAIPR